MSRRAIPIAPALLSECARRLGGTRAAAARLGVSLEVLKAWRYRASIPRHRLAALLDVMRQARPAPVPRRPPNQAIEPADLGELIRRLGKPAAVARRLGVPRETLVSWRKRGRIPGERLEALLELLRAARLEVGGEHPLPAGGTRFVGTTAAPAPPGSHGGTVAGGAEGVNQGDTNGR